MDARRGGSSCVTWRPSVVVAGRSRSSSCDAWSCQVDELGRAGAGVVLAFEPVPEPDPDPALLPFEPSTVSTAVIRCGPGRNTT